MHALKDNFMADTPSTSSCIIDGNALLHAQKVLPETFRELAFVIFRQLPKVKRWTL